MLHAVLKYSSWSFFVCMKDFVFSDFRLEKKHIQTCKIIKNNIRYKCNKIGLLDFHTTCIQALTFLR